MIVTVLGDYDFIIAALSVAFFFGASVVVSMASLSFLLTYDGL